MSTESKNIRVLYLGPSDRPGVYTKDLDQQSKAVREMGAQFVVYDGNSEGELIEALKAKAYAPAHGLHLGELRNIHSSQGEKPW